MPAILFILLLSADPNPAPKVDDAFFEARIRPVLAEHCYECHGPKKQSGGLRLDSRAGLRQGGDSGAGIAIGDPATSIVIQALRYDGLEMPPKGRLPPEVVADFEHWVRGGAPDPRDGAVVARRQIDLDAGRQWWAFRPVASPPLPAIKNRDWPQRDSDHFVLARLESAGLRPSPDAEPAVLLRRLYYDLTGLPPDDADIAHFVDRVQAGGPGMQSAVEDVADRLLASPQYGEKWGRHWLDLARYADSNGSSCNVPYKEAWRYRNWVIDALNGDMPFDVFVTRQLAGDLLPANDQAERDANLVATGYLMLGSKVLGLFDKPTLTMDVVDEQVDVLGKSLLGLTLGCARCHDHKFDPLPQRDYYALAGIFTSTVTLQGRLGGPLEDESDWNRRGLGSGGDERWQTFWNEHRYEWVKATNAVYRARKKLTELETQLSQQTHAEKQPGDADRLVAQRKELESLTTRLAALEAERPALALAVRDAAQPADTHLRIRGVADSLGAVVPRGFLQVAAFEGQSAVNPEQSGRLELARWITSPQNPLTARVWVNRVWKHLFREGLVRSVDNFGLRGDTPTHPELLDHLARSFVEDGWRTKRLVRALVTSRAYRQAVVRNAAAVAMDPENRLLWRQNRRRLEPEELRDTLLAVARQLDRTPSEASLDHLPLADVSNDPAVQQLGDKRRTIYQPIIRTQEPDILQIFDAADSAVTTGARSATQVAPQALYFLNSPEVHAAASTLAHQLDELDEPAAMFSTAFRVLVGRQPRPMESRVLRTYLTEQHRNAPRPSRHDLTKLVQVILASTQFQFLD